jgi:hypothetical protein
MITCLSKKYEDTEYETVARIMGQELVARVPGRNPSTAAEFAAINLLRSFSANEIRQMKRPIAVDVIGEPRGGKGLACFNVRVSPSSEKQNVNPSWSVSATLVM